MKASTFLLTAAILAAAIPAQAGILPEMTPVLEPGNPPDKNGLGTVHYVFNITRENIDNQAYAKFLNAVDPLGRNQRDLYNPQMTSHPQGGIVFTPSAKDGAKYQPKKSMEDQPVRFVNWYDAVRFANWLNNGARKGSSTEVGAYNLRNSNGQIAVRDDKSDYWVPNVNELYKAGYYLSNGVYLTQDRVYYAGDSEVKAKKRDTAINLPMFDGRISEIVDVGSNATPPPPPQSASAWQGISGLVPVAPPSAPPSSNGQVTFAGSDNPYGESESVSFYIAASPEKHRRPDDPGGVAVFAGAPDTNGPAFLPFFGSGASGGGNANNSATIFAAPPPAS